MSDTLDSIRPPLFSLMVFALTLSLIDPGPARAELPSPSGFSSEALAARKEFAAWARRVENPRHAAELLTQKDIDSLDEKAGQRLLRPEDVLEVYRDRMLDRVRKTLRAAEHFSASNPEVAQLNDFLVKLCHHRLEILQRCVEALERHDLGTFRKEQIDYLMIDDQPYRDLRDNVVKRLVG